jgi:hypothetical protein
MKSLYLSGGEWFGGRSRRTEAGHHDTIPVIDSDKGEASGRGKTLLRCILGERNYRLAGV